MARPAWLLWTAAVATEADALDTLACVLRIRLCSCGAERGQAGRRTHRACE
jgi:hypothetical protein